MFKRKIISVIKAKNPEKGFEKVMDFINVKCNYGTKLELLNNIYNPISHNEFEKHLAIHCV